MLMVVLNNIESDIFCFMVQKSGEFNIYKFNNKRGDYIIT